MVIFARALRFTEAGLLRSSSLLVVQHDEANSLNQEPLPYLPPAIRETAAGRQLQSASLRRTITINPRSVWC